MVVRFIAQTSRRRMLEITRLEIESAVSEASKIFSGWLWVIGLLAPRSSSFVDTRVFTISSQGYWKKR